MTPRVSVVLPVFNVAPFLSETLDSLCTQSFPDFELIAVDDGSTDQSAEILDRFAAVDSRIRVIKWASNRGIVAALNEGLQQACGGLIARMDGDDACHPDRFSKQVAYMDQHPEVGVVGCQVAFRAGPGDGRGFQTYIQWLNSLLEPDEIELARFIESPLAHPSVLFRRELVDRYGMYRQGPFPEDYELWLRWLDKGVRMAKVPQELLIWRDRDSRLTRTDPRYRPMAFYRVKAEYLANWLHRQGQSTVCVWGAGRVTRKRARLIEEWGVTVDSFIDIDPRKIGREYGGRPVVDWRQLPPPGNRFILSFVASLGAREQIRSRLKALGYQEGAHFLLAA